MRRGPWGSSTAFCSRFLIFRGSSSELRSGMIRKERTLLSRRKRNRELRPCKTYTPWTTPYIAIVLLSSVFLLALSLPPPPPTFCYLQILRELSLCWRFSSSRTTECVVGHLLISLVSSDPKHTSNIIRQSPYFFLFSSRDREEKGRGGTRSCFSCLYSQMTSFLMNFHLQKNKRLNTVAVADWLMSF